ncbi:mitochondrial reactive oxygen species modulator 1 (Romo1/Mgr2) [Andalucia godoyi]|uniref:Mitochondrial reactive oxygen species modulator 1 (Romo1/Mgr2) n=1 Tax=Andalucia godoyi TaxID=505711 RepID=A0A8K0AIU4_ANDGO|nr:mitochondrial reactive oxygen species modulator 1 (Romo1/Mgr2) [Andalucia godoyi]|eukprot:ANDGO_00171.mRNA.1 mitochondrial reactive oxygen species modulator 1 (Romo1/Mgr2)
MTDRYDKNLRFKACLNQSAMGAVMGIGVGTCIGLVGATAQTLSSQEFEGMRIRGFLKTAPKLCASSAGGFALFFVVGSFVRCIQ